MKVAPEQAVQAVMGLFWRDGYKGMSTRSIETDAGITRFTLQSTYGGKKALFLQALDQYQDVFEQFAAPPKDVVALDDLIAWFEDRVNPKMFAEQACFGCLMMNSMVEFGGRDADVNARTQRFFTFVRGRFLAALTSLDQRGVFADGFDAEAGADVLMTMVVGINVSVRAAGKNSAAAVPVAAAIGVLRSWT